MCSMGEGLLPQYNRQGTELWTDGLICSFEFVRGQHKIGKMKIYSDVLSHSEPDKANAKTQKDDYQRHEVIVQKTNVDSSMDSTPLLQLGNQDVGSHWVPIGWTRISELVQKFQADAAWSEHQFDLMDDEDDHDHVTVADLAAPYWDAWEHPTGPMWWCHMAAGHPFVNSWLNSAQWLHPAISIALRDKSRLISEKMKHLLYEVPVRVAGGLLFELLGQSAGDPYVNEDDIPIVLRSFQAQNFLITVLHMKGSAKNINVLGISEVQDLLSVGGYNMPRTVYEVIAHLASRLARWDDRLFRKSIFGAADEIELKFVDRRNNKDLHLLGIILNQEIRRLSRQVIRVKWSLHAQEEIVFELLQHLRGNAARTQLEGIRKSTRQMIEEQEAVRGHLFTIQDVMQSNIRAWLQICFDAEAHNDTTNTQHGYN